MIRTVLMWVVLFAAVFGVTFLGNALAGVRGAQFGIVIVFAVFVIVVLKWGRD